MAAGITTLQLGEQERLRALEAEQARRKEAWERAEGAPVDAPEREKLNAAVTKAIFRTDWALEAAILAYQDLFRCEEALVKTNGDGLERDIAQRGAAGSRVILDVLKALRGRPQDATERPSRAAASRTGPPGWDGFVDSGPAPHPSSICLDCGAWEGNAEHRPGCPSAAKGAP